MVGTGTGIAPFRSFWLQRQFDKAQSERSKDGTNSLGDMVLYFGCRSSKSDDLYSNEINALVESEVINKYYVAYSREPNMPKVCFILLRY